MRYSPSESELIEIESSSAEHRIHYFLTRIIEAEEVWSLGDDSGWAIKEVGDKAIIPIWPYKELATVCAQQAGDNQTAVAVSLEQFVYTVLPKIDQQNIQIEIMPTNNQAGKYIQAQALASIFEGMMESGEYYMEG